jgi:RNA polymerase sigma-70 factor (ECF subfamily)
VRHSVLVNGVVGALCFLDGKVFSVAAFTVRGGKIVELDIIRQPTLRRAE